MIRFACPWCAKSLKSPWEGAGRQVRCPRCRRLLTVPDAGPPPVAEELPEVPPQRQESYSEVDYRYERRNRSSELWAWLVGLPLGLTLLVPIAVFLLTVIVCCGVVALGGQGRH